MRKFPFPYIGVTGLMSQSHLMSLVARFPIRSIRNYGLMAGVLVSSETLSGQPAKWPGRYPEISKVKDIFLKDECALNLIHYATKDAEPSSLLKQLNQLVEIGGRNLDGLQLNIPWPDLGTLIEFKRIHPEIFMVLQVGAKAMGTSTPEIIAVLVKEYSQVADYALIDPSGGHGQVYDVERVLGVLRSIRRTKSVIMLGVAGGFGPGSMDHLMPIAREFPGISIDAEGRLRTPHPEDRQDMDTTREYIHEASILLAR